MGERVRGFFFIEEKVVWGQVSEDSSFLCAAFQTLSEHIPFPPAIPENR